MFKFIQRIQGLNARDIQDREVLKAGTSYRVEFPRNPGYAIISSARGLEFETPNETSDDITPDHLERWMRRPHRILVKYPV